MRFPMREIILHYYNCKNILNYVTKCYLTFIHVHIYLQVNIMTTYPVLFIHNLVTNIPTRAPTRTRPKLAVMITHTFIPVAGGGVVGGATVVLMVGIVVVLAVVVVAVVFVRVLVVMFGMVVVVSGCLGVSVSVTVSGSVWSACFVTVGGAAVVVVVTTVVSSSVEGTMVVGKMVVGRGSRMYKYSYNNVPYSMYMYGYLLGIILVKFTWQDVIDLQKEDLKLHLRKFENNLELN